MLGGPAARVAVSVGGSLPSLVEVDGFDTAAPEPVVAVPGPGTTDPGFTVGTGDGTGQPGAGSAALTDLVAVVDADIGVVRVSGRGPVGRTVLIGAGWHSQRVVIGSDGTFSIDIALAVPQLAVMIDGSDDAPQIVPVQQPAA